MKKNIFYVLPVLLAVIICGGLSLIHTAALAKDATAIEWSKFNTDASLADNLKIYTGRDIQVHLRSGKTIQGYVKSVGSHFLHLEKLAGRDFYDALVRIDDISAFEAKFRDLK